MKRETSIEALLQRVDGTYNKLKILFKESPHKSIDTQIDIKDIFEHLRSCLDYLAHEIFEKYDPSSYSSNKKKIYFPIRQTREEFNKTIEKCFPFLLKIENESVYYVIENIQPYHDPWIDNFNKLTNHNKHHDLSEQIKQTTISNPINSVSWKENTQFGERVYVMGMPMDSKTQTPILDNDNSLQKDITICTDFYFKDKELTILPFIEKSIRNVKEIYSKLKKLL